MEDNQFIPRITSILESGKQIRFTQNSRPFTTIRHLEQKLEVTTRSKVGVEISKSKDKWWVGNFKRSTQTHNN